MCSWQVILRNCSLQFVSKWHSTPHVVCSWCPRLFWIFFCGTHALWEWSKTYFQCHFWALLVFSFPCCKGVKLWRRLWRIIITHLWHWMVSGIVIIPRGPFLRRSASMQYDRGNEQDKDLSIILTTSTIFIQRKFLDMMVMRDRNVTLSH